eukprot:746676-Hanusia_phi.AAC.1
MNSGSFLFHEESCAGRFLRYIPGTSRGAVDHGDCTRRHEVEQHQVRQEADQGGQRSRIQVSEAQFRVKLNLRHTIVLKERDWKLRRVWGWGSKKVETGNLLTNSSGRVGSLFDGEQSCAGGGGRMFRGVSTAPWINYPCCTIALPYHQVRPSQVYDPSCSPRSRPWQSTLHVGVHMVW